MVFSLSHSPSIAEASNPFVRRVANGRCKESFAFRDSEKPDIGGKAALAETAIELQQMVPVVLGRLDTYKSLQNVLRSALDEHESLRGVTDVPDDMYRRTHVNLQSVRGVLRGTSPV